MPKRAGGIRKKRRTHVKKVDGDNDDSNAATDRNVSRCFVIKRGHVNASCKRLVLDWRQVMAPNCALKLRESARNSLKDFTNVAGVFGVTHMIAFSQTNHASYMRLIKLPEGPTLTFKVHQYTLIEDVRQHQAKPRSSAHDFLTSPVLIMNGFRDRTTAPSDAEGDVSLPSQFSAKMLSTFIGGMFPAIDIQQNASTRRFRRAILFHRDRHTDVISIRHYCILRRPTGLSEGVKKIVRSRLNPAKSLDFMNLRDVSDIILNNETPSGAASCCEQASDCSDTEPVQVTSVEDVSGKEVLSKLAISLCEIGPRLQVSLVKVEEGVAEGRVLYHRYIAKTKEQLEELAAKEVEFQKLRKRQRKIEEELANAKRSTLEVNTVPEN